MEVVVHNPPPVQKTYDIVGLTEEEMAVLDALTGSINGLGDYKGGLWFKIRAAREEKRALFELKDCSQRALGAITVKRAK